MSRLEEIKEEYTPIDNGLFNLYFIEEKDYKWLIQQAERFEVLSERHDLTLKRVEELERENKNLTSDIAHDKHFRKLAEEKNREYEQWFQKASDNVTKMKKENERYKQLPTDFADAGDNIDDLYYYQDRAKELMKGESNEE